MRFLSIVLVFAFSSVAHAQNIDVDIENGVLLYNQMRNYSDGLKKVEQKDLDTLKNYINRANPLLTNGLSNGTTEQKKTSRYFLAMLQYELGFTYGKKGENKNSYTILKAIGNDIDAFADSTYFPLRYKYANKNYQVLFSNFSFTAAEYYTGMGEVCTNLSKYDEAVPYLKKAIDLPFASAWLKNISANKLWQIKSKKKKYDQEYLDYSMTGLQYCSRLDTSYQSIIKKNNYTDCLDYADTLRNLLTIVPNLYNRSALYAQAAVYLDSANYEEAAMEFYRKAYELDKTNKALLRQILAFATRHDETLFKIEINLALAAATVNEKDVVIRNLGTVLDKVLASATDPKKHFDDLKGKKFNVPHYGGKPYHSSVELDGALNTFIDEIKGDAYNYYYWKSFIAEEPKQNLQGSLKKRYLAICNELKSLYPQATASYMYNDPNYFKLQLTKAVTLEFNYYYNEGYKDMLLLSVSVATYNRP